MALSRRAQKKLLLVYWGVYALALIGMFYWPHSWLWFIIGSPPVAWIED